MIEKLETQFLAAGSRASGGTTPGSWIDLRKRFGAQLTGTVTNGATAPTTPARVQVWVSTDGGSTEYLFADLPASADNNGEQPFVFDIPPAVMYARVKIVGGDDQTVTYSDFEAAVISTLV